MQAQADPCRALLIRFPLGDWLILGWSRSGFCSGLAAFSFPREQVVEGNDGREMTSHGQLSSQQCWQCQAHAAYPIKRLSKVKALTTMYPYGDPTVLTYDNVSQPVLPCVFPSHANLSTALPFRPIGLGPLLHWRVRPRASMGRWGHQKNLLEGIDLTGEQGGQWLWVRGRWVAEGRGRD